MISALIGSVIMSAVTVALLMAVEVTDEALSKVGKHPLTSKEEEILRNAGWGESIKIINEEIKLLKFNFNE